MDNGKGREFYGAGNYVGHAASGSGNEEPKRELVDAKTVQAQVEKLTPEQMARVEEVKNGINLMDSRP